MISTVKTYLPVFFLISLATILALAPGTLQGIEEFSFNSWMRQSMGFFVCLLAFLKIIDLSAFLKGFNRYDLLSSRWKMYGITYPYMELMVGLAFLSLQNSLLIGLLAVFLGVSGSLSILKHLREPPSSGPTYCACTGGRIQVPLGALSMAENAAMVVMGTVMIFSL